MRRDLSTVRKLESIEKEMGYCEIKLERAQRLHTQLTFLKEHKQGLDSAIRRLEADHTDQTWGNRLGRLTLLEVYHKVALERSSKQTKRLREIFSSAGALPFLTEERDLLVRKLEETQEKLDAFEVFQVKKHRLGREREAALRQFKVSGGEVMTQITDEFERTEQSWNTLTEDLINLDTAIFHVARAVDYLQSARSFVLSSRSQFSIDVWLREGYLIDLFKHSTVGRGKEMVEGADRNLRLALMELICLEDVSFCPEAFEHLVLPFLENLFEDLFLYGKLRQGLEFLEERIERVQKLFAEMERNRGQVLSVQNQQERNRVRLFQQIGDERRRLTLTA
ncbi:MAG: hypothetical protein V3T77_06580 [Planctomycetota bacterium]